MSVRLSPILEPSRDTILVGDPRRAFALGQVLTVQPKMSHLARGLWGYTGTTGAGKALTVQSTGVGGASAVAVIADLAEMGVRRIVRLGTCVSAGTGRDGHTASTDRPAEAGAAFLIRCAHPGDGASRSLTGTDQPVEPDPGLNEALAGVATTAEVFSHDLPLRLDRTSTTPGTAVLRDLQTAATFAVAKELGLEAAAILVVAETGVGTALSESVLEQLFEPLGRSVAAALAG